MEPQARLDPGTLDEAAAVRESDLQLALRAAQGDVHAFERIMRRYNQRLFRLAFGIVGEAGEAEDVLQESYVRAFYALPKYSGQGGLSAWLAQIVRHEAIDRLRARNVQRKYIAYETELGSDPNSGSDPTSESESILDKGETPGDDVRFNPQAATENFEMKRFLEEAIQQLPDPFRSVFMLREVEGLSIEETAQHLGIPAATVKTRDHRARKMLKQQLGERIDSALPETFGFLGSRCDSLVERVLRRLRQ